MHSTMENIKEEEESRLLAASPKRRVAQAYSTNDRNNACRKYTFWLFTFFAFVVVLLGHGDGEDKKQKRAKKLRNKAETMPESEVQKLQKINSKIEINEKYAKLNDAHAMYEDSEDASLNNGVMEDEDGLSREVDRVFDDVEMAEQDEIDTKNSMLTTAVKTMEDSVKFYLGKVFGYGEDEDDDDDDFMSDASADVQLSEEQLDMIAKKISDRLEMDVKTEFREKADSVKEEKVGEIEKVVAEDRQAKMNPRDIENDVKEAEAVVMEDLKDEIDDAAERVKDEIPERVKKIRNDVVEEVTGKKLDLIEQSKRDRKQKKIELMQKFQKMQARAKETEAKRIHQLNDEDLKKRNQDKQAQHFKRNTINGAESVRNPIQNKNMQRNQDKNMKPNVNKSIKHDQDMNKKPNTETSAKPRVKKGTKPRVDKLDDSAKFGGSKSERKGVSAGDDGDLESGPSVDESNHSGDDLGDEAGSKSENVKSEVKRKESGSPEDVSKHSGDEDRDVNAKYGDEPKEKESADESNRSEDESVENGSGDDPSESQDDE
mmetsp:Transcript_21364/g.45660  ORF Transcript_21364/g.45660 Transcript_21364/m.45660 type:complete len:544 (+) Transcript_21364:39-1670(+)